MSLQAALKDAARIQYTFLRLPLEFVDTRLVQRRLDESSPVRRTFESALQRMDSAMEQWLGDPIAAPPPLADTAGLVPPDPDPTGADPTDHDLTPDETRRISSLTDELLAEEETGHYAGELAENDDLRRVQAEIKAKQLIEEQDE